MQSRYDNFTAPFIPTEATFNEMPQRNSTTGGQNANGKKIGLAALLKQGDSNKPEK